MKDEDTLENKLRALESIYLAKLPGKFFEISSQLRQFALVPSNLDYARNLIHLLHTLAGSAGTFGMEQVGDEAHQFELRLKKFIAEANWSEADRCHLVSQLSEYLDRSTKASHRAVSRGPSHSFIKNDTPSRLIYLVDEDVDLASGVSSQIEQFGCEVIIIAGLRQLSTAIAERLPVAIVIDLESIESTAIAEQDLKNMMSMYHHRIPFIFISNKDNFESRLAAVRLGASGYMIKPIDVVVLADHLDVLITKENVQPHRVMIVDDDPITSEYYATILRSDGMSVLVLQRPDTIFKVLSQYRPELILLDIYMPGCNGVELSKMIRQDNRYIDVPIVFLSSESDRGKQLEAMRAGADDFLTKPIEPEYLISAVSSRAERYRSLRSLIMRDGLTGLFNHSATKERIISELTSANRRNSTMSIAVLDLDNFKSVNDAYGHHMGDQVLRILSRLLQQRLRQTDIVGRYGGEEFVVILPNTTAQMAALVLNKVREAFSKIVHHSDDTEFCVTFSVGVADLTNATTPEELFGMADSALYRAKQNGRNCLELAKTNNQTNP